jgi:hypothetical protein
LGRTIKIYKILRVILLLLGHSPLDRGTAIAPHLGLSLLNIILGAEL